MSNDNTTALTSGLYIVPTPIGNLQDITLRALNVLANVDIIAAEDTRHTKILLQHFSINARLISIHDHNETQQVDAIIDKLKQGLSIALVSDAGTPLINDPGYHLVHRCQKENIKVIPLPGPCAAITALSASGLPSDRFCYEGFLPAKTKARKDKLSSLLKEPRTVIFYESTHRILDCLVDMMEILGSERQIVLAKELTKTWETIYSAPINKLYDWLKEDETRCRGEIVLIIEGYKSNENEEDVLPTEALETLTLLQQELALTKACALTAKIHNIKKNKLYQYALSLQQTE